MDFSCWLWLAVCALLLVRCLPRTRHNVCQSKSGIGIVRHAMTSWVHCRLGYRNWQRPESPKAGTDCWVKKKVNTTMFRALMRLQAWNCIQAFRWVLSAKLSIISLSDFGFIDHIIASFRIIATFTSVLWRYCLGHRKEIQPVKKPCYLSPNVFFSGTSEELKLGQLDNQVYMENSHWNRGR